MTVPICCAPPPITHDAVSYLTVIWPAPRGTFSRIPTDNRRFSQTIFIAQVLLYWQYLEAIDPHGKQPTTPECLKWDIQEALKASGNPDLIIQVGKAADDGSAAVNDQGAIIYIRKTDNMWRKTTAFSVARTLERIMRRRHVMQPRAS